MKPEAPVITIADFAMVESNEQETLPLYFMPKYVKIQYTKMVAISKEDGQSNKEADAKERSGIGPILKLDGFEWQMGKKPNLLIHSY